MKYINTLLLCLVALTFNACGDDEPTVKTPDYTTVYIDVSPDSGYEHSLNFETVASWTLSSDQVWCQLRQGDKQAMSLTGAEGQQHIDIVIDAAAATDQEQVATLTLNTNGKSYTLANVTLATIAYRGVIKLGTHTYTSDKSQGIYVFDYDEDIITIQANFDFYLEMPEWCLVNDSPAFEGKADEVYEVKFSFNETAEADKRYKHTGELAFVGQNVKDVFTIAYTGMNKYAIEISMDGTGLSPWNWSVDARQQTYTHSNGNDGVQVLQGGITFYAICRNDDIHFLFAKRQDGKQVFETEVDYAAVEGSEGKYTFSVKDVDDLPSGGMLLAFPAAAWDTIKADPAAALTVWSEEDGRTTLSSSTLNNVAVSWSKYVPKTSPFTVHHLNKVIEDGDYYGFVNYETTSTTGYGNIFGDDAEVWQFSINPDDVDVCIELDGYTNELESNMFSGIKAGFDEKLDIDIETLRLEPWECPWPFDLPKKAAVMLNLSTGNGTDANPDYRAKLATSPLFIMMPVEGKTYGLVIIAER